MSRLIVLALFLAVTVMATYQETPLEIATRINKRDRELYNAGKFTELVDELYTEDAVVEFFHAGPIATGHAQILAILENRTDIITEVTGLAIQNVVDNSTFDVGFVSLMVERDNGTVFHHYQTDQAIVDGKIVYERSRRL